MMRLYLDGKEVDPAEYSFAPLAGVGVGGGVVTLSKPVPPGTFTLSFEPDEEGWKYGDLAHFKRCDSVDYEADVMYLHRLSDSTSEVLDLGLRQSYPVADMELTSLPEPVISPQAWANAVTGGSR